MLALTLLAIAAIPVGADVTAIENHVTDAGYVGALPGEEQRALSSYLRAHQGGAHYEPAAESATGIGSLIVQDARPVLMLTTYEGRVFTTVPKLQAADRRRRRALRLLQELLPQPRLDDEPRLLGARRVGPRSRHRRFPPGGSQPGQDPVPAPGATA